MGGDARPETDFVVEPLSKGQVRAVYPLVRHAGLGIDLKSWLRYARPLAGAPLGARRGAIVVRRTGQKLPCGLFCYARETDLVHGNVLKAEHFVALDIVNPADVMAALLHGLDVLSTRLGCRTVRSVVNAGEVDLFESLRRAGHTTDATVLCKLVTPARTIEPIKPV
jgi:hypothetical protein